jgi:hypothetical protein
MRKFVVAALAASALLALIAGTASARTGLRAEPSTSVLFIRNLELTGGFGTVRCNITQSVTLHSSVAKSRGALAGQSNVAVSTNGCANGNAGILVSGRRVTGLQGPYHVQYQSFEGTLPSITSIRIAVVGVSFWITEPTFGVTCLTAEPQSIVGTTTGGNPATGISVAAAGIALEGGFGCGFSTGSMSGSGSIFAELALGRAASVRITLI